MPTSTDSCFSLLEPYQGLYSRQVNDPVYACSFPGATKWLPGVITAIKGPLSYEITLTDNRVVRRHVDHIRGHTPLDDLDEGDCLPDIPADSPAIEESPAQNLEPALRHSTHLHAAPK